jgi:serine phosphatase RsbU (regulator of sigma subunit)
VAETLQRSLLLTPPPDAYPGLRFKAFYRPALDEALVGGDFFDVFAVRDDVIALVVGDATGKGLNAATYTAEIRFALRPFYANTARPRPPCACSTSSSWITTGSTPPTWAVRT